MMASLSIKTVLENDDHILKIMTESSNKKCEKNIETYNFTIFDSVIVLLSMISIIVDMLTDIILVVQYFQQGYVSWAVGTFILIFFPSLIVQGFSMRWHVVNNTASHLHCFVHMFMCGIIHRYIKVLKSGLEARKSKDTDEFQQLFSYQSDLCILHLFESFLESAPQLVLQLYIIVALHEWRLWTAISALGSLISLAWALAAYTRAQRRVRPDKQKVSWPGLILQASWRLGMLTARIAALVIFAYCFGSWIFLFIGLHWIGMTTWIIHQQTDLCDTPWEERVYNGVAAVIYCFCFFNLQEGRSRLRALVFYLVVIFQNLTCLTVFLMLFGGKAPKLALWGFVAIVGGSIIGMTSMVLYYRFFHPSGPILLWGPEPSPDLEPQTSPDTDTDTLRSLKRLRLPDASRCSSKAQDSVGNSPLSEVDKKQLLDNSLQLTDSIVVIEESTATPLPLLQDSETYKRRAICSSVDLHKLLQSNTQVDHDKFTKEEGTTPSELSAHDYENLACVNIARETWGLRSWEAYSDIETWLHDDSIVRSRRGTLTSTSTSSSQTRQDDYLDTLTEDLALCESEYSLTLGTILEELEESNSHTESESEPTRNTSGSASALVATIEEIRLNTPVESSWEERNKPACKPRRKFSLIRERFETKRTDLPERHVDINKENIPTVVVANKISHWEQNAKLVKDKSNVLLKQVLGSPPKFTHLRNFPLKTTPYPA